MDPRRLVPRTDAMLTDPRLVAAAGRLGHARVKAAVAAVQQQVREGSVSPGQAADTAVAALPARASSLAHVLNATGVVLHTNLGRAPLSQAAREAVVSAAGYTDLEFDLTDGSRGRRGAAALAALAAAVPAAESVHVVNNNAAALVLAATAIASVPDGGRDIVVSRGELIEIGDRFRLTDLLESTGASLREVGTTNRTTLTDYAGALTSQTAFILKVHPSNYRIEGFTSSAGVAELATLGVPVVGDIGSGLLSPHPLLPQEPDAGTWLRAGAALVTASGDKLLGGPQAGLILGRADLVTTMARHPLARALRAGKLTYAALEATLTGPVPPVAAALGASARELSARAAALAARLASAGVDARTVACEAAVGGGGAPGVSLPSAGVSVPGALAGLLRDGDAVRRSDVPAVVGRAQGSRLLLDMRCVAPDDDPLLAAALLAAWQSLAPPGAVTAAAGDGTAHAGAEATRADATRAQAARD